MSANHSDETYQELAQANLMRMRGQSKEAIELCLAILRKHPGNVAAHALLGDIYYEEDDLVQAAEWYELTVDLDPGAKREKGLLERIRSRVQEREHLQNLKQLGIQKQGPPVGRYMAGMAGLILLTGVAAYFIGGAVKAKEVATQEPGVVSRPIVIPPREGATTGEAVENPDLSAGVAEDDLILGLIRGRSEYSNLVRSVVYEPGRDEVILTAEARTGEARELTALMLASDVFVHRPSTKMLRVRLTEGGKLVFSGELTREQYDEAQALSTNQADLVEVALAAFPQAWQVGGLGSVAKEREEGVEPPPGGMEEAVGSSVENGATGN